MNLYEQLVKGVEARKQKKIEKERRKLEKLREPFLSAVEKITGQSRYQWPEPQFIEEEPHDPAGGCHWLLVIDDVVEFRQKIQDVVVATLSPTICCAACQASVYSWGDLENLVAHHLSFPHFSLRPEKAIREGT